MGRYSAVAAVAAKYSGKQRAEPSRAGETARGACPFTVLRTIGRWRQARCAPTRDQSAVSCVTLGVRPRLSRCNYSENTASRTFARRGNGARRLPDCCPAKPSLAGGGHDAHQPRPARCFLSHLGGTLGSPAQIQRKCSEPSPFTRKENGPGSCPTCSPAKPTVAGGRHDARQPATSPLFPVSPWGCAPRLPRCKCSGNAAGGRGRTFSHRVEMQARVPR
jgi:hypothetical protein